jgi:hypothetical protein
MIFLLGENSYSGPFVEVFCRGRCFEDIGEGRVRFLFPPLEIGLQPLLIHI